MSGTCKVQAPEANFSRMLSLFVCVASFTLTACSPAPPDMTALVDTGEGDVVEFTCVEKNAQAKAEAAAKATGGKIRRLGKTDDFLLYDFDMIGSRRVIASADGESCKKVLEMQSSRGRTQGSGEVADTVAAVVIVLPLMVAGAMVGLDLSQF